MRSWLLRKYRPDYYYVGTEYINWQAFYNQGYRLLLIDIDNTLQEHGMNELSVAALKAIARMQEVGFALAVVSNAREERVKKMRSLLKQSNVDVMIFGDARKPSPRRLLEACRLFNMPVQKSLMLGDQLFTDIKAGKNAQMTTVLVKPISKHEPWYIRLKRVGETFILNTLPVIQTPI